MKLKFWRHQESDWYKIDKMRQEAVSKDEGICSQNQMND